MTPEQKQKRLISEIEARHEQRKATMRGEGEASWSPLEAHADVGHLLSLVKEQEAGGHGGSMETPARIVARWLIEARNGRALESVLLKRDRELLERYIAQLIPPDPRPNSSQHDAFCLRWSRQEGPQRLYDETLRCTCAEVNAAAAMRSACVEALKRRANNYLSSQSGLAGMEVRTELEAAAKELESTFY